MLNPSERLFSVPAGCSSLGDLLSRSSRLGIPLRDLLRLAPALLNSASGSQTLLGFPLQAFWSWSSALTCGLITSQRCQSKPYTATTGGILACNGCVHVQQEGQHVTLRHLESFCISAAWPPMLLRGHVWKIQTLFPSQPAENRITNIRAM